MKQAILKRAAALLLAAAVTAALSACAVYADIVQGFADTVAYMSGETNVRSEMTLSVKMPEAAKQVSFSDFLNRCLLEAETFDGTRLMKMAADYEIGLSFVTETYEDTALVSVGWLGAGGVNENLITVIITGQTVYISTELLGYAGGADALAGYGAILSMIDCDYIRIDASEMEGLLNPAAGVDLDSGPNAKDTLREAAEKMSAAMREYTPKVLTKDYKDVLKRENGGYTLTLNTETALALLREVLNIITEYEADIKAFLLETADDLGMGNEVSDLDVIGAVREIERELDNAAIGADIPEFDMVYKVLGTGGGDNKKQTSSLLFTITVPEGMKGGAPIGELVLKADGTATVAAAPVRAPDGKVLTVEELTAQIMGGIFGGIPDIYGYNSGR